MILTITIINILIHAYCATIDHVKRQSSCVFRTNKLHY